MGKHSAERRSPLPLVLGVVAVLAIAAAAFFGFRILTGSNSGNDAAAPPVTTSSTSTTSTTSTTTSATTSATPTVTTELAAAQKALQDCVTRQNAAQPVIAAATGGAQHWADHLQGQYDIDTAAKTYIEVKTNVFGPSRAAGPGDIAAYDTAMTAYSGVSGCENVGSMEAPADMAAKLKACGAREQAIDAYMGAAKAVMEDWRVHLSEMADHSDGHLNGPEAQQRWLDRYKAAPVHMEPYKQAAAALAAAPACNA